MTKFIQYNINPIKPFLKEFTDKIKVGSIYNSDQIQELYQSCKNFETDKTQLSFKNILARIALNNSTKNQFELSYLGKIIKYNPVNENLLTQIVYMDLYLNTDIFRIECDILFEFLKKRGNITKRKEDLEDFIIFKVTPKLETDPKFQNNIDNATNKISLTIQNLKQVGILKEKEEKLELKYFDAEYKLIVSLLHEEFPSKKITFEQLFSSNFRKMFFLSKVYINGLLDKMSQQNLISIENRAGLSQFDKKYRKLEELVEIL